MIPDEPAPDAPSRRSVGAPAERDGEVPGGPAGRGRLVLSVAAVACAVIGLIALAAILLTAFLGGTVWPGFVLASYFCLPIAFLLMATLVVLSALARRRS